MDGFDPSLPVGIVNPTNVNYDYTTPPSAPLTLIQQQQNLANLLYNPRPPVYVVTNAFPPPPGRSNEFRFYLDLNRNGAFDPSGPLFLTNSQGKRIVDNNNAPVISFLTGDPQWIGGLQRPEFAHSASNQFTHRYAYLVVPASQTLDINTVHNYAKKSLVPGRAGIPWPDGFFRNQGVLRPEEPAVG